MKQLKGNLILLLKRIGVWRTFLNFRQYLLYLRSNKNHHSQLKRLRTTEQVKVIFLVYLESVWKYECLFDFLKSDSHFDPIVAVVPIVKDGEPDFETYKRVSKYFESIEYPTLSLYDSVNLTWLDLFETHNPDIIFFTNPYNLTFDKYYKDLIKSKVLKCYVPYAFVIIHRLELHYGKEFHKSLWKYFVESKTHKFFAQNYLGKYRKNVVVSGYPALDIIFNPNFKPKKVWKETENNTYKIIWAPHHSIEGQGSGLDYSCFLEYAMWFIELLGIRSDIQIAFKPHPLLKEKLYKHPEWGSEKTDSYYDAWNILPNGQLEDSDYVDLFYESDALIHDSASFMVEYLYFEKPSMFLVADDLVSDRFNSFGKEVFSKLYKGRGKKDVLNFIDDVLISGNDDMKNSRDKFFKEKVLPKGCNTASENIYNELRKELCP